MTDALKKTVTDYALVMGFDLVRVTSAEEFVRDRDAALERINEGLMDGLPWYHEGRVRRGSNPHELLPGARSIICLGLNYYLDDETEDESGVPLSPVFPAQAGIRAGGRPTGRVAKYARLRDYHRVMKKRMRAYVEGLRRGSPCGCPGQPQGLPLHARWYVDDGPMLDRAAAARAGLGWFGKNTNILTGSHGSWIFLGQIITDLDLEADAPSKKTCGACVRCIDACPTGAIVAPYVIDNARCISYQTIENRGPIPLELRSRMLDWVFGCDICQDVCPVNRKAVPAGSPLWSEKPPGGLSADGTVKAEAGRSQGMAPFPRLSRNGGNPGRGQAALDLLELAEITEEEFRRRFRGTPVMRAKYAGIRRNACVALGNIGDPAAVPVLRRVLDSAEPLVRGHAAWALGQIGTPEAKDALKNALAAEADADVLIEIRTALG